MLRNEFFLVVIILASLAAFTSAFISPRGGAGGAPKICRVGECWLARQQAMKGDGDQESDGDAVNRLFNRREVISRSVVATTAVITSSAVGNGIGPLQASLAKAEEGSSDDIGTSPDHPIVVIGAGGKTGKLCSQILNGKGLYIRAVTRSGRQVLDSTSEYVTYAAGDVTNCESIKAAVAGASGVIFAASASGKNKGGDPAHVDYLGVYNTAKACIEGGVRKLAVISAATVTRPDSAGFKATNFFVKFVYGDKIMDYKIAGEEVLRDLYASSSKSPSVAYTIIRPGGLNERPSVGSNKVLVTQGDAVSSEVTREDIALVTVAALLKGKATDFTTFEVNQVEGFVKAQADLPDLPPELIHAGSSTFDGLLNGLLTDSEMRSKEARFMNNFRGENIEPVDKVV